MTELPRIPVFQPWLDADLREHLAHALDVGWLGMGAFTQEFEQRIADFIGGEGRHVVAANTGTSALHMALLAAGVGPGDEVITPSFNYVADHQAIRMAGAEVVMCDIREDNLGIDCDRAAELVSDRTRAIIPLHFAGVPCDRDGVYALAQSRGLRVVEDAMHAFGTEIGGRRIGSDGDICCFSFDPVKIITSVDGGCVLVNSEEEKERLRNLRFLGVDKETTERYKNKRAWDYDVVSEGFRYHLTNIMASVGISQIKQVEALIASRVEVCNAYSAAFAGLDGLRVLRRDWAGISPFVYSVRVLEGRRADYIAHMDAAGIDCGVHFVPVHEHAWFRNCRTGALPVTEQVTREVVTLPLHSHMDPGAVERVIEATVAFFR